MVNLAGYVDHTNKIKQLKVISRHVKIFHYYLLIQTLKKFVQIGSSIEYGKIKSPQIEFRSYNKKNFIHLWKS